MINNNRRLGKKCIDCGCNIDDRAERCSRCAKLGIKLSDNQVKKMSKRMTENNPMYKKESREKLSKTLKERFSKGLIKPSYGNLGKRYNGEIDTYEIKCEDCGKKIKIKNRFQTTKRYCKDYAFVRNKDSKKMYCVSNRKLLSEKSREWEKRNPEKQREIIKRASKRAYAKMMSDDNLRIKHYLRNRIRMAIREYSRGRLMSSNELGIDYEKIIKHLKPFPDELSKYHIDHIKPLCLFDLTDRQQIEEAFRPENHQWLTIEENLSKGGRYNG